ncbi:MAG: hypothetical protein ACOVRN_04595 [Flavobacterium sp.]
MTVTLNQFSVTKDNVSPREYSMYKYLDNMNWSCVPKLYHYDKGNQLLTTQKIIGLSVADTYGESFDKVPVHIVTQIRDIIRKLYTIGVVYPNITGYNFIIDHMSHVWIVNFKHSFYMSHYSTEEDIPDQQEHLEFVQLFCYHNESTWNPYFA